LNIRRTFLQLGEYMSYDVVQNRLDKHSSFALLQHRCTIWQKTHLYRLNLNSECMQTCFLLLKSIFRGRIRICEYFTLSWDFKSLYQCVFCQIVQRCWDDAKLHYSVSSAWVYSLELLFNNPTPTAPRGLGARGCHVMYVKIITIVP